MRAALPLSVQLLLTFVGLLTGMTVVFTTAAHTSLIDNLEADASGRVAAVTLAREQAVTQLFELRQRRAEGFLASVESLCAEPLDSGRTAWVDDCVKTMVDDFRTGERAIGARLSYGGRPLRHSGVSVPALAPPKGALARVERRQDGTRSYIMRASRRGLTLTLGFDERQITELFRQESGLDASGEVLLINEDAHVLAASRGRTESLSAEAHEAIRSRCRPDTSPFIDTDHTGGRAIQSVRPVPVLGSACVMARVGHAEAIGPAERLKADLATRGAWFVAIGAMLSLVAAQWISAPVRRLAVWARQLKSGRFDRPIPLRGPSEVRALGRAFNAMGNDLAELVAKEQAARREAEAANRAKDDFLATVSHELRTPLTAVLGWAHMLRSNRLPADQARHAVEVIERSANRQRQLIEDLLDVSRIAANRLQIAREPLSLSDVVDAALDAIRPQAAERKVEIETDIAASLPVRGDARRLEQVVWNLAWNAVKFTAPSGRVTVRLTTTGSHAVLSVADTGIGISSSFLPHVFDWFRQADDPSRQGGLGLGLGIVRHIVRLHGGSVRAESRGEGKGATFTVTLPLHTADAMPGLEPRRAPVPPPSPRVAPLAAVRVVLVEDDDDTRELVRRALESAGASVDAFATPADARREVLAEAPDVFVSDIRMPEEDGYALMRSLRSAGVQTPAIALTAFARREDADAAHAAGFQLHVAKPVDTDGLVHAVEAVMQKQTVH